MSKVTITDQKKEEIRYAADIVDVVSDYVKLKKSGSSFIGLCPFHNEKTPSFNVTPRLGIFKCFGCGKGGDVFNFVMEMEGVGFVEAMRSLAERYNIELPEEDSPDYDERTQLFEGIYHALRFAGMYYHQQLMHEDEGELARNYLVKRGLKVPTIKKFGLGYAPDSFDAFYNHALSQGINEVYLAEAGLVKYSEKNQKPYDVFRGRLMFPIFSPSSKVIGFGGRVMKKDSGPKYINSPQTKVYNKSEVIYGIHLARNEIRKLEQSVLVEGYMDVISLWQHGITNAVATSGTAVTGEQMRMLKNYADSMLMVYDADNAGQAAMLRGLDIALAHDMEVRLMHLPDGEDPDSYVQQYGAESFRDYAEKESKDFISFMVGRARELNEWDDPYKKNKAVSQILSSLAYVNDKVMRENLVEQLRKLSGVSSRALFDELGKHLKTARQNQKRDFERRQHLFKQEEGTTQSPEDESTAKIKSPKDKLVERNMRIRPGYEKEIIRLMIEYGEDMVFYVGNLINEEHFEDEELRKFYEDILERYNEGREINANVYTEKDPPFPQLLGEILIERHSVSEHINPDRRSRIAKDRDPFSTARGALKAMRISYLERIRDQILARLESTDNEQRPEMMQKMVEARQMLLKFERTSASELFPTLEELEKQTDS